MRCFIFSCIFVVASASLVASASDLSCPPNSKGKHPKCICGDDLPYDEINRICATKINYNALVAKCPKGSEGQFPACVCAQGKVYVPDRDECVAVDRSKCPPGAKKVNNKCVCETINEYKYEFDEIFWICRPWYVPTTEAPLPPCPPHQHRVGNVCEWEHCPAGYESKTGYWPECYPPRTCQQEGKQGTWPNCHAIVVVQHCAAHMSGVYPDCHWLPCPADYITKSGYWPDCHAPPSCSELGMIGRYPDCHPPPPTCPPHHHRDSDGNCVRIKCPPGQEGDYQPNCKLVPKCPQEYPGIWPNCNIYATTPSDGITTPQTTPRPTTTPRTTRLTTPRSTPYTTPITTTPRTTPRSTPRTTTPRTTPRTTTPRTTLRTTTPRQEKCYCDCLSNEIVMFKDNVVRDPSRKYKRFINQRHSDEN